MICMVGHPVSVHSPATHACPDPPFRPLPPQFWKSACVSRQVLPQRPCPTPQPHVPAKQVWLLAHAIPQPPQLAVLLFVSTQEPLQSVSPVAHPAAHMPALQTWAPHELPQLPQFATSALRLTHLPLQRSKPTSQTHAPALQICDAAQAVAQSLQCIESLFV